MLDAAKYFESVGEEHRQDYGQFFTHPDVARFMVQWVLASGRPELYDPAFGLGAFLDPVAKHGAIQYSGSELDSKILSYGNQHVVNGSVSIAQEDYLLTWGKRHSNIVCNPPYMRFQKFLNRNSVFAAFAQHLGVKLSGYTNTASAFLLKSLSELDGRGRLAYIMPLEFLNTGYGTAVKTRLLQDGHLVAIISIDCEKDIFPDATTSVGILLYDAAANYPTVNFYSLNSVAALADVLEQPATSTVPVAELNPKAKWLPYFQESAPTFDSTKTVPLNYYGRFSRGIATGANEFFVLRPSTANEQGFLPSECLPCITRSSQITKTVFECDDYSRLQNDDQPVLLFSANGHASPQAQAYIEHGEQAEYHLRFLTKSRNPWYKTEVRSPAPLLLGVFSRGGYKIILNRSGALNLTCYHGFQPNLFGTEYIEHLFLYLLSKAGRNILSLSMRKYGDALDKFEPNDLNSAAVPSPEYFDYLPKEKVAVAIRQLEAHDSLPDFVEEFFTDLQSALPCATSII